MKRKIRLTEGALKYIIRESAKKILREEANYKKGLAFINESMVAPYGIERVWVLKGHDDAFFVKGDDGYYYDVYPTHHDSYKFETDSDLEIESILKKVNQAFNNHGIQVITHNSNGEIYIEPRGQYNGEFDKPLRAWLERNGFTFKEYDDMYGAYLYTYNNYSNEVSPQRLKEKLADFKDITYVLKDDIIGSSAIDVFRNLADIYRSKNFAFRRDKNDNGTYNGYDLS